MSPWETTIGCHRYREGCVRPVVTQETAKIAEELWMGKGKDGVRSRLVLCVKIYRALLALEERIDYLAS